MSIIDTVWLWRVDDFESEITMIAFDYERQGGMTSARFDDGRMKPAHQLRAHA